MGLSKRVDALYVCIYVPEFPAQALMRLRPELAQLPVVVLEGEPPLQEVCSANAIALRLGIAHGMTRAELSPFEGLCLLRRSEPEERNTRAALLAAMGKFTPRMEVQPSSQSSFVAVLDMTGTTRIFGPISQAIANIARSVTGMRLFVQLSASANLHAAVCLAPSARKAPRIVPSGYEAEHLSGLPLSTLNLDLKQAEALSLWGLQTLGDLAGLPEVDLVVRLGPQGKRLRLLAHGECPHLMVPEEPAFALEEYLAFDSPLEILDSLLFVIGPMLDQLLARAQDRALALASVTVKLGLDGGGEHERTIRPALPVGQREVLLKLLHLDLQANPPSAGVLTVFVHAEPGARSKVQFGLFAPQLPEATRLDVTLARIASLVGEDRVGRAKLLDTHSPDGFKMERFVVSDSSKPNQQSARLKATLRRCRPPQPISMQHEGACLASFSMQGRRYIVQQAYGPWRKSGEWWTGGVWSREEWDIRAESTANDILNCVVTHNLLQHQWQLEGVYD